MVLLPPECEIREGLDFLADTNNRLQLFQLYSYLFKHRPVPHTVICVDEQDYYLPGDVAQIRLVVIFVVPAEILDDLRKANEKAKRTFAYR